MKFGPAAAASVLLLTSQALADPPVASCAAPVQPYLPKASGPAAPEAPESADMALFVVGPNHIDVAPYGNANAAGIQNIAIRIKEAWHGDPAKLVIAISDTGGCSNCGSPATVFAAGTAHVLEAKLHQLYGRAFQVRRAIPALATDYAVMPALITGGFWAPLGGNFIGKDFPSKDQMIHPGASYRYGRIVLSSPLMKVGFSIVHLYPSSDGDTVAAGNRLSQIQDLMNEINSHSDGAEVDFIAGDFNQNVTGYGYGDSLETRWFSLLVKGGATWMSGAASCSATSGIATLFGDILNAVEVERVGSRKRLRPFRYFFDADPDGAPLYPARAMNVSGIAHPVTGVLFKFDGSGAPARLACSGNSVPCGGSCVTTGTSKNCTGCGQSCSSDEVCQASTCAPRPKPNNPCSPNVECSCSADGCATSSAQCHALCLHGPRNTRDNGRVRDTQ